MSTNTSNMENISFEKVEYILTSLSKGAKRNKLAYELGYTNPKSLDIYMRRKGFLFDKTTENYTPIKSSEIKDSKTFDTNKRLNNILSLFSREDLDSRQIANLTGFHNHIELAEFMKSNAYTWNDEFGTYVKIINPSALDQEEANLLDTNEFYTYLPLLRQLYKNKTKLLKLVDTLSEPLTIPNFSLTGEAVPVMLSLNKKLNTLVNQFSAEKLQTVNQIYETAVVEFIIKYGFEDEMYKIINDHSD